MNNNQSLSSRCNQSVGQSSLAGILINYSNGKKTMHGGDKFRECHSFTLSRNERIQRVELNTGWMIDGLTFWTNMRKKYGPYGGSGGNKVEEVAPAVCGYLAHLTGCVVDDQDAPGIRRLAFVWGSFDYRFRGEEPTPRTEKPRRTPMPNGRRSLFHQLRDFHPE